MHSGIVILKINSVRFIIVILFYKSKKICFKLQQVMNKENFCHLTIQAVQQSTMKFLFFSVKKTMFVRCICTQFAITQSINICHTCCIFYNYLGNPVSAKQVYFEFQLLTDIIS